MPLCDLSAFLCAAIIASWFHSDVSSTEDFRAAINDNWTRASVFLASGVLWLIWFGWFKHVYARGKNSTVEVQQLVQGIVFFALLDLAVRTLHQKSLNETWWATAWFFLFLLLPTARWGASRINTRLGIFEKPIVIIGHGENAKRAFLAFQSTRTHGVNVSSFAWPRDAQATDFGALDVLGLPVLVFGTNSAEAAKFRLCRCVIALEAGEGHIHDALILQLAQWGITDVDVVPAMEGVPLHGIEVSSFFSHDVLLIHLANKLAFRSNRFCKRLFDIVLSSALLIATSPIFFVLAFLVSRDGGNVFFGHGRVGRQGKVFDCYKIRTMVPNAEEVLKRMLQIDPVARAEWEACRKLRKDPRITKIGHLLRSTSLDELPQLWNVLKGEMSLVGPRPVTEDELARYGDNVAYYLMTRPGMTGLWQVSGRSQADYTTRVYLDSWYVKNWSIWSDLEILLRTVAVVSSRSGAY